MTQTRLENADAEPQNWLMGLQNYSSHRYSRLAQINRENVGNLRVAFVLPITSGLIGRKDVTFENYPLVDGGFMYVDDAGGVFYKYDVRSGNKAEQVWRADAAVPKDISAGSRGIAMWGNGIYHNLRDGRVVGINRDTGEFLWDRQVAKVAHPKGPNMNVEVENFTAAPIAADGKLLVGNSAGDAGSNGWLSALNITNGAEIWRTYTIPGPGEAGHETWKDDHNAWKTGGAALWTVGSYDVAQRITIWGTGQPVPMYDPEFRPGDNLFSNSVVGFDIDTGKMKWYFQYTPNESWDYDEQGVHMLIDAPFGGTERKMVNHFGRNGFFYYVDRTSGAFINATQFVDKVTWTAGIDPKTGKPVEYNPTLAVQTYVPSTRFLRGETNAQAQPACPTWRGGVRWQPPAYNPLKRLAYSGGMDGCFTQEIVAVVPAGPEGNIVNDAVRNPGGRAGGKPNTRKSIDLHGLITANDVTTGKIVARHRLDFENQGGVLATAGGLVFSTAIDGIVTAHNDETLAPLWRFELNSSVKAAPISYAIGGKQFIALMVGAPQQPPSEWPTIANQQQTALLYVFTL